MCDIFVLGFFLKRSNFILSVFPAIPFNLLALMSCEVFCAKIVKLWQLRQTECENNDDQEIIFKSWLTKGMNGILLQETTNILKINLYTITTI